MQDDVVLFVDDGEIFVHSPQVASHKGFQLGAQVRQGLLKLCLVFWLNVLLLTLGNDGVNNRLGNLKLLAEGGKRRIAPLQLITVLVDIVQIGIDKNRLRC